MNLQKREAWVRIGRTRLGLALAFGFFAWSRLVDAQPPTKARADEVIE